MQDQSIDYSRKWFVLAAVGMGIFLGTVDGSIVNVALPTLVRELNTDFPTVQWVVLGYLLTQATLMLSIGRMGDMIGKKPIYTLGFITFTLGSVLCGLAPTVYWLIGFRVFQAIGAAMTFALGMAIVTEAFPPEERGRALGINGTVVSVGIVVGPTLGGVILDALTWNWIFFVNLPVGIIGTWMVMRFVPDFKPKGKQQFDYWGAGALFVSLLALLLALTWGQGVGFTDMRVLGLFMVHLIFLAVFVLIELKTTEPMVDLRIFRNRLFSINLLSGFLSFLAIAGTIILIPFYLENVLGYGTRETGLLLATVPILLGVIAPVSGSLSDRFGTRPITVIGLAVLVAGYYAMSTLDMATSAAGFVLRFVPIGLGMGIFQSPNNSAVMGSVPRERLGIASGLLSLTRSLGQTTGIAVLGALWAARTAFHHGAPLSEGVTAANALAQTSGLHDTFLAIILLISFALILSTWGLMTERRMRRATAV